MRFISGSRVSSGAVRTSWTNGLGPKTVPRLLEGISTKNRTFHCISWGYFLSICEDFLSVYWVFIKELLPQSPAVYHTLLGFRNKNCQRWIYCHFQRGSITGDDTVQDELGRVMSFAKGFSFCHYLIFFRRSRGHRDVKPPASTARGRWNCFCWSYRWRKRRKARWRQRQRVVQQFKKSIKRKSLTAADSDTSLTAGINIWLKKRKNTC